ncbi:MAG: hypothetical protein AAF310_06220 [Myxococcota bacterium]
MSNTYFAKPSNLGVASDTPVQWLLSPLTFAPNRCSQQRIENVAAQNAFRSWHIAIVGELDEVYGFHAPLAWPLALAYKGAREKLKQSNAATFA